MLQLIKDFICFSCLILISVGLSKSVQAEYRVKDYGANNYSVPASKRDLWSVTNGVVEAKPEHLVAFHSRADQIFSIKPVANSPESSKLVSALEEIPPFSLSLFRKQTLDQWMASQPVTGLLVMKGNSVLYEKYQYERTAKDKFLGNSMSKSVVGMLVGIALQEKAIESIDDVAEKYEPRLTGHPYGATMIRSLLTMTSGMSYLESKDVSELWRRTAGQSMATRELESVKYVRLRGNPQGQHFNYNSVDTQVLTLVLIGATGKSLSEYTSEKLWMPIGAESPAFWMTDVAGAEAGFMGFNATLRDWGRLGLLWANLGAHEGQQIISTNYMAESRAWKPSGYGYHVWLTDKATGQVAFFGVRGQTIFVDPASKLVMVITAVREQEYSANTAYENERKAIWNHILSTYKN